MNGTLQYCPDSVTWDDIKNITNIIKNVLQAPYSVFEGQYFLWYDVSEEDEARIVDALSFHGYALETMDLMLDTQFDDEGSSEGDE